MHERRFLLSLAISTTPLFGGCQQPAGDDDGTATTGAASSSDDSGSQTTTASVTPAEPLTTDGSSTSAAATGTDTTGDAGATEASPEPAECEPGAQEDCAYGGPAGTAKVGTCNPAVRTCDDSGRWGACAGEVLPRVEDCRTAYDEDCDGRVVCLGEPEWARGFGEPVGAVPGSAHAWAVTVDGAGQVWFAGKFASLQIGDHAWEHENDDSLFFAQLDGHGEAGFAFADLDYGAAGSGEVLAAGPDGRIALGAIDVGRLRVAAQAPSYVTGDADKGAIVGVFGPSGSYQWDRAMMPIGTGDLVIEALRFDGAGNLWAAGSFHGDSDIGTPGSPQILHNVGDSDALLIKMGPDGALEWVRTYGDQDMQEIHGMAIDAGGNIWLAGGFEGQMAFDGGALTSETNPGEGADMFVVKLDGAGKWQWGRVYGDEKLQLFTALELDPSGNAVVLGRYNGTVHNLGVPSMTGEHRTVVKFAPDGDVRWAAHWPSDVYSELTSLAVDGAGQVVVAGRVAANVGAMTIAGQTVEAGQTDLGVLIKLDREGVPIWPARTHDALFTVAAGPLGEIYMAGGFSGKISLDADETYVLDTEDKGHDAFVARLSP